MKYILNDKLIDQDRAFIHVHDLALLRGYGIFDFFRLIGSVPLFIDDHLNRFYRSAAYLRLEPPLSKQELKAKIIEMLEVNRIESSGVRIVLTGGESPNGYFIGQPTLFVINEPMGPPIREHFENGIKLISLEYQRDLPEVKSINYLVGIYHLPEVQKADAIDILYKFNGHVSESTRSNFFIVNDDNVIVTPGEGVLKGINRMKLIEMCQGKFPVKERPVSWNEVLNAKEAFITGTSKKVTPVIQIDDRLIADGQPGALTKELQSLYDGFIDNYVLKYK